MAKLPDGWILIPRMKDAITIEVEQRELVTCKHCQHADCFDKFIVCRKAEKKLVPLDFFCADGERIDKGAERE